MAQSSSFNSNPQSKPSGASAVLNGRYIPPPEDGGGQRWVRTSAIIQASPEALYARWRDLESAPQWHGRTVEVRRTGDRTSHWMMKIGDKSMEWDSEILADEPGKRIAWHSIGGDLEEAGEVIFEPTTGNRGTMVTVLQQYRMGAFENLWQTFTGRNPKQSTVESLRHFKALAETGEIPTIEGQPHGRRGAVAKMKRSTYGETAEKPKLRRAS
jgi:uncharacterized membrane protein